MLRAASRQAFTYGRYLNSIRKDPTLTFLRSFASASPTGLELFVQPLSTSFPYRWLRDSCQCSSCVHPSTRQKLHRTSDIASDVRPTEGGIESTSEGVHVRWNSGHESFYPFSFLESYSSASNRSITHRNVPQTTWDRSLLTASKDLFLSYESLQTASGLLLAITHLCRFGIVFITGVSIRKPENETCELRRLGTLFGELRETFYGEVWDVKSIRNSRNIAYTNLDLGLHMDLLYFESPPRYQVLHCIRNRVIGGASIFVDALHAGTVLQNSHPSDFNVLAETPVPFHYINDGHHLHFEHPTFELDSSSPLPHKHIRHINYSPPFQAPLLLNTPPAFYGALEKFAAILDDPSNRFEYTLRESDAVIFDNRRVLHARTAFRNRDNDTSIDESETNRWLKGCYLEADAVLDRGRVLRARLSRDQ